MKPPDCALPALVALLALQGCIARTAVEVATLPVKATIKAVDLATTSQSEADEKRGREMRQREERLGRLERRRLALEGDCAAGDSAACTEQARIEAEIEGLLAQPQIAGD